MHISQSIEWMDNKRMAVMDMNSAKALDEACNHNNDRYNDEVLYAGWVEPSRSQAGLASVSAYGSLTLASFRRFMMRLSLCQE